MVWIFGSGRTGSTWLGHMLGDLRGFSLWNEPRVGALFGEFCFERYPNVPGHQIISARKYWDVWLRLIETTVLESATVRFEEEVGDGYVVAKEPHGTVGAPLLVEALPESRMILLARDPRDVTASALDARSDAGWATQRAQRRSEGHPRMAGAARRSQSSGRPRVEFAASRAQSFLWDLQSAAEAYAEHAGKKALVRYEDLRANPLPVLRGLCEALGLEAADEDLAQAVARRDWDRISEDKKGPGKPKRKATPGGWREDLTPEEAAVVEEGAKPVLDDLYGPDNEPSGNVLPDLQPPVARLQSILDSRQTNPPRSSRPRTLEARLAAMNKHRPGVVG